MRMEKICSSEFMINIKMQCNCYSRWTLTWLPVSTLCEVSGQPKKTHLSFPQKDQKFRILELRWPFQKSLDMFGQVWTSLDKFGQVWTSLDMFGHVWTSLETFEQVWTIQNKFKGKFIPIFYYIWQVWTNFDMFGQI